MVSLFCSHRNFRAMVGTADSQGIQIEDFGVFELPDGAMINGIITDESTLTRFLSIIGEKMGLLNRDAVLVIDANSIRSKVMEMPIVPEAKMLEFVARDLGAFSEVGSEDIFDYSVLNPKLDGGGVSILAVAVNREIIQTYRNTFTAAGFRLKNINIRANVIVKLAHILPQLMSGACILAIVHDRNLSLSLFENGEYRITNNYRLFNPDNSPEWAQEIGNNISSVMQFHKGQRPVEDISAVYFAGLTTASVGELKDALSFPGIDVAALNVSAHVKLTGAAEKKSNEFFASKNLLNIGALLRA